jgi:hypothetical protein
MDASKTQIKRAARIAESEAFVKERRRQVLTLFQQNFETGLKFYEDNKEKMSAEEQTAIEAEIEKNLSLIKQKKEEWGLNG